MALRVLSGMVFIPRGGIPQGNVVISFDPFELSTASNSAFELRKIRRIGPAGRFIRRPASIVAVRQFSFLGEFPATPNFRGRINDTVTRDFISISWSPALGIVDQEEIPFMVIGEVPDARTRTTRQRPRGKKSRGKSLRRPSRQP